MNRLIVAAVIIAQSGLAVAQGYEAELRKREICRMWGQHAVWALEARHKGEAYPPAHDRDMGYMNPVKDYINDEVFVKGSAPTASSARALGVGHCLDNLDRLAMEERDRRR